MSGEYGCYILSSLEARFHFVGVVNCVRTRWSPVICSLVCVNVVWNYYVSIIKRFLSSLWFSRLLRVQFSYVVNLRTHNLHCWSEVWSYRFKLFLELKWFCLIWFWGLWARAFQTVNHWEKITKTLLLPANSLRHFFRTFVSCIDLPMSLPWSSLEKLSIKLRFADKRLEILNNEILLSPHRSISTWSIRVCEASFFKLINLLERFNLIIRRSFIGNCTLQFRNIRHRPVLLRSLLVLHQSVGNSRFGFWMSWSKSILWNKRFELFDCLFVIFRTLV